MSRLPVDPLRPKWHDSQRVDVDDMDSEQDSYLGQDAAIVNNHFGSGVVPSSPVPIVLFNTDELSNEQKALIDSNEFDGTGIHPTLQPSDPVLGNQIQVRLEGSSVFGRQSVRVAIIGVNFNGDTQFDTFEFHRNERQITCNHYVRILAIFFNNFKGNTNCSREYGGTLVFTEAASFELSRDPIAISQDVFPNIFWRDYKVANPALTLYETLQIGIGPEYTVDSLLINTTPKLVRSLNADDTVTRYGEKFIATTNNIQKITLLLGATPDLTVPIGNKFDWSGDIVVSIFPLQTTVNCPTDIVPGLQIGFDPEFEPLVQLTFSQVELFNAGYILTDIFQPVDFVFSTTKIANPLNSPIVPGRYYAATIGRTGSTGTGDILVAVGGDRTPDARATIYSGVWTDVPDDDLWFQVWTDAAKVADGEAYDQGKGIQIPKKITNELGVEEDYCFGHKNFVNVSNALNTGVIEAAVKESDVEQDERTGNPVFARQQYEPIFSFVDDPSTLDEETDPLIIGCGQDKNPRNNPLLLKSMTLPGLVNDDKFIIVAPDADILSFNFIDTVLKPNVLDCLHEYRIFRVTQCVDGYGDVNGDGVITEEDACAAALLIGEDLSSPATQQKILDGYFTTLQFLRTDVTGDGVISEEDVDLIRKFANHEDGYVSFPVGSSFRHTEFQVQRLTGRYDGYFTCTDGYMDINNGKVPFSALSPEQLLYDGYDAPPCIQCEDPIFITIPFPGVDFELQPQAFWSADMVPFSSDARLTPAAFTYPDALPPLCEPALSPFFCEDTIDAPLACNPGRNDFFVPANLILGGDIIRPDGRHFGGDYEMGIIILELPENPLVESVLDIFNVFVADVGNGYTALGYRAMRFASCDTVKPDGLEKNQIRFDVALQAFNPNLDGYDGYADGYGVIVDDIIGVHINPLTGVLTLNISDLEVNILLQTLVTKIQIIIHLKQGGWINPTLVVPPSQAAALLSS